MYNYFLKFVIWFSSATIIALLMVSIIDDPRIMIIGDKDLLVEKHLDLINKLEMCESEMNPSAFNKFDTDGKEKFGCMQFDTDTAREFLMRYGQLGLNWDDADLKNWLYDCPFSRRLAAKMIDDGFVGRWGCYYKIK